MATTMRAHAAFTAKLLAPLPADAEAVDSEDFRKVLQSDQRLKDKATYNALLAVWERADFTLKLARHESSAALYRWILNGRERATDPAYRHMQIVTAATRRLMLTDSPGKTQLAWKRKEARRFAEDAEVLAALAADEARIAPKQEA